jgi:lipoprotein-anchoring transpeptidase ErfK/SrfK
VIVTDRHTYNRPGKAAMGNHGRAARPWVYRLVVAAVSVAFGGLVGVSSAQADDAIVEGTPCTEDARACVDLAGKRAWLIEDGRVVRGPVPASVGAPRRETPRGDFRVEWKNTRHRSTEHDGAVMPFAVFFAEGGIAFHEGSLDSPSAGCVRLGHEDAVEFYDVLQVDDPVQVR